MPMMSFLFQWLTLTHITLLFGLWNRLYFLLIDLGSAFWGMVLVLASTKLLSARIAAGCLVVTLIVVLFVAKNVSDNRFP